MDWFSLAVGSRFERLNDQERYEEAVAGPFLASLWRGLQNSMYDSIKLRGEQMGLLQTRWEAEYEGHKLVVARSEWTKGFKLEWDGETIGRRTWSWVGLGELQASAYVDDRTVEVKVEIQWGGLEGKCAIMVDGERIPVRLVK